MILDLFLRPIYQFFRIVNSGFFVIGILVSVHLLTFVLIFGGCIEIMFVTNISAFIENYVYLYYSLYGIYLFSYLLYQMLVFNVEFILKMLYKLKLFNYKMNGYESSPTQFLKTDFISSCINDSPFI